MPYKLTVYTACIYSVKCQSCHVCLLLEEPLQTAPQSFQALAQGFPLLWLGRDLRDMGHDGGRGKVDDGGRGEVDDGSRGEVDDGGRGEVDDDTGGESDVWLAEGRLGVPQGQGPVI